MSRKYISEVPSASWFEAMREISTESDPHWFALRNGRGGAFHDRRTHRSWITVYDDQPDAAEPVDDINMYLP